MEVLSTEGPLVFALAKCLIACPTVSPCPDLTPRSFGGGDRR